MMVEGLGSLPLSPAALGGLVSLEVSFPADALQPILGLIWYASLSSVKDDDNEELAPHTH